MTHFTSTLVQEYLRKVVLPVKLCGIFPFKNDNGVYKWSFYEGLYSCIVSASFVISGVYFLYTGVNVAVSPKLSVSYYWFTCIYISIFPLVVVLEHVSTVKNFNNSVKTMLTYETTIPGTNDVSLPTTRIRILIFQITVSVVILFSSLWDIFREVRFENLIYESLKMTTVAVHSLMVSSVLFKFSGIVGLCTQVFGYCNKEVLQLAYSDLSTVPAQMKCWKSDSLLLTYSKTTFCVEDMANTQKCAVLFVVSTGYVTLLWQIYDVLAILTIDLGGLIDLLLQIFSAIQLFSFVWQIIDSCENCRSKANEFNKIIYQLAIQDNFNEIISDKLKLHITMKREIVFTACGFFNLDYSLIYSMVAAATTYLVILIQFGWARDLWNEQNKH